MSAPEKPKKTVKEKADVEGMECEGSPSGEESDMNVDSPPSSEQPMSEEASSSAKTGDSLATEGTQASASSTRSDIQDAATSSRAEESVLSGRTTASTSSTRSDPKDSGISAGTEGSPEGVISPRRKKLTFEALGEAIGKKMHQVRDRFSSPRKHDSPGEEGVVSPKSKGKSRTPKKGSKSPTSPGQGATLSPEQGETSGKQRTSPMKEGKPSRFRLFSSHKDKKGDQRAPQRLDLLRDPEQEEDAQLTAIQSPPRSEGAKGVRKSKSFFGFGSGSKESKSPSAVPQSTSEDCLHLQEPKEKPDEKSDSTVSLSLSPISERRESDWANFEANFGIQSLGSGEQKADVSKSSPEGKEETSETASQQPSVTRPDVQQEMETEDKLEATSGEEPTVADPAVGRAAEPEVESAAATGSDTPKPSVAEPATESSPREEMEAEEEKDEAAAGGVPVRGPAMPSKDYEEVHPSPSKKSKTDE